MKIEEANKGYLLALLSVIAVANVYIFSKAALAEVSISQFGVYWFSFGLLWILLYAWYKKSYKIFKGLSSKNYRVLLFLGIIEIISTYYFFKSIHVISNPTIVSFLGNMSPVFMIVLSFFFLKERFGIIEFSGMILGLFVAFVIIFNGNMAFRDMFINRTPDVLLYSFFSVVNYVVGMPYFIILPNISNHLFSFFAGNDFITYGNFRVCCCVKTRTNQFFGLC